MRDFVGEHPVLAELEHRVVRLAAELLHRVEDVDRQPFEGAIDSAQTQHRVGVARSREEKGRFGVFADLAPHMVAELHRDLTVARLVPALACHVELQRERCVVEVEVVARATGAFECLDLADEDAMHQRAGPFGGRGAVDRHLGRTGVAQGDLRTARIEDAVFDLRAHEPFVSRELRFSEELLHPTETSSAC